MTINKCAITIKEPKQIFVEAEAFFNASFAVHAAATKEAIKNNINSAITITYAAFVNHAYAFELYLKCLQGIENGVFYPGHDLVKLFNYLSKDNQEKIIKYHDEGTIYGPVYYLIHGQNKKNDFKTLLQESSNAFVNLRYNFDHEERNDYELDFAIKVVRRVILELRPSYESNEVPK